MEPLRSGLKLFREDFERHIKEKKCSYKELLTLKRTRIKPMIKADKHFYILKRQIRSLPVLMKFTTIWALDFLRKYMKMQ